MRQGRSSVKAPALRGVAIELDPARLLAGWQAERASIFVPALSDARVGEDVAVRIGLSGTALRATVLGRVVLARRVGRPALPPGVEIAVDAHSVPAMRWLCRAAKGEAVPCRDRSPRWVVPFRIPVQREDGEQELVTQDVSEGGCCVLWPGTAPRVGDGLQIRVRDALFASTLRAVVCWTARPSAAAATHVGLRLQGVQGRAARAWRAIVDEASRTGAAV